MSIDLGPLRLTPPVFLAPMAGITDLPFRRMVARFGAGLVVSEMVASGEMLTAKPSVRAKARADWEAGGVPTSVQLAGREARPMAEAARLVADMGAAIIDINMGCPARKVTGGLSGAALMRDPDHALRLIEAVTGAVDLPVTLKLRLGWDNGQRNAAEIAARAEAAGVRMIVVHGRTRMQFYSGQADWAAIAAVRGAVRIPVVANGDIVGAASARVALDQSGAAGVMVGRGAQGKPWALAEITHALHGTPAPEVPQGAALADLIAEHYEAMLGFYGVEVGLRLARKHLGWYAEAAAAPLRAEMMRAETPAATLALIGAAFADTGRAAA
ncbi:tRNA dihydrouridine synthase DusB [Rhodobacter veldkampii DSM 11550]|uniref:tRNA-dihydrouridine synthase n=1 Tax=Phaeovulum veldkampii DSM 11550 TaxID=1185920 RepID=A0A2T4JLY8_9RHOB|nr:tRNA dihydrouridine synthase DusB [Phaeovulum veldkampii]MBK5945951.1 tRNA dihydrouridine synthase DusB [Phaeovulum veldkampii DSM 11550]PTE18925.1 tRNA dihydrouridine synthase DusB [Phaeovulum veldkampii DSM 11550]TDQ64654.1 tRNA-U20-dihydrouridine synthase [Phaeovulum veldkampii DSM 11550]